MIGLLVEGPDDAVCYRAICRKLGQIVDTVNLRGKGNVLDAPGVERQLRVLMARRPDVEKAIVMVDANSDEAGTRARAAECETAISRSRLGMRCRYHVVRSKLESWLSALPETLAGVLRHSPTAPAAPSEHDLQQPEQWLRRRFGEAGRRYLPSRDNALLAEALDTNLLADRYANFADFLVLLRRPWSGA